MKPFIISRVFKAPVDLIFEVWTDPAHMQKWFSPKGTTSHYAHADIRPGGSVHYYMQMPDGSKMWAKAEYKEIVRPTKIVYNQWFSDEQGGMSVHPLSPTWPKMVRTTVTLEPQGNQTKLTLEWIPLDAAKEEIETFEKATAGMNQGWSGTFEQLARHLEEIQ